MAKMLSFHFPQTKSPICSRFLRQVLIGYKAAPDIEWVPGKLREICHSLSLFQANSQEISCPRHKAEITRSFPQQALRYGTQRLTCLGRLFSGIWREEINFVFLGLLDSLRKSDKNCNQIIITLPECPLQL